ncbi:Glycerol-3-phosphate acyltransferase 1 [Carex littledalei]|uniref:Glycerol-3-phosphate acyltransferase 1 n=1 Tax=Carex littledalei TaxID=544730 RepID=A0A833RYF8_9POAL|nr:Glycerol-3-phosphate acyltransferase 1 [Carex littledalei]
MGFIIDFYFVDDAEKRKWHALQRDKYLKPLVFHDGRLAIRPTPFAALAMYMWLPLGILLSLIRSLVSVYLPYNISIFIGAFFGMKTRVSFETLVNQCNNADAKCEKILISQLSFLQQMQTMSPPPLASSVRKNIIRIRIKKAGAVLRSTKEELHPNSSPDMKPHKCTCCSSQVARVTPAESPTRILELMTAYPLSGRPLHSPLRSRISDLLPLSNQMGKLAPKRPSEGILASGPLRRRRYKHVRELRVTPDSDEYRRKERRRSMILYFGAVLKFLHVASLGEHRQGENNEAAMYLYSDTAKLSQYCAAECENENNLPDASLAYKAMELAHMKAASLAYISSSLYNMPAAANEAVCLREGEKPLSMILYFRVVLKFLRVASLLEHGQGENNEASMCFYSDTAKLCQYCAAECGKENNIPAAALAYKAMELAHMKAAALAYTSSFIYNMPAAAFITSPAIATN